MGGLDISADGVTGATHALSLRADRSFRSVAISLWLCIDAMHVAVSMEFFQI